jgi:hypothetical protein
MRGTPSLIAVVYFGFSSVHDRASSAHHETIKALLGMSLARIIGRCMRRCVAMGQEVDAGEGDG